MASPLNVLLAAHADAGAPRFLSALRSAGYAPKAALAASDDALAAALAHQRWDVVVVVPGPAAQAVAAVIDTVRAAQPGVPVVVAEVPAAAEPRLRGVGADAVVPAGAIGRLGDAVARVLAAAAPSPAALPLGADPRALAVQDLAEHLPVGLYQSTPDGKILYANEALATVLGYDHLEDLAAVDVRRDLGYPREQFEVHMARFGSVRNLVVRWTDHAGRTVYTRENARVVRGEDGEVCYFEGTMEDVTAEYAAHERDRRRTEQLAAIVRFATAVDAADTADGVHAAAVDAAEAVTGARRVLLMTTDGSRFRCAAASEVVDRGSVARAERLGLFDAMPFGDTPVLLPDLADAEGELPRAVLDLYRERGVRAVATYPLIHHGRVHGAFLAAYDEPRAFGDEDVQVAQTLAWHVAGALARHRAEAGLRASEACLRFIAEHTDHVLYRRRYDAEAPDGGAFDYLSPAVEVLVGYAPTDLDALGGLGALVEEREVLEGEGLMDAPPGPEAFEGDGTPPRYVARYRMRTRTGEPRWVENVAYVWTEPGGEPVGLIGTLTDVTERKRKEETRAAAAARALELQRALVELGTMGDAAPEAVIRRATELAAEHVGVDRVLVRVLTPDETEGEVLDLYLAAERRHTRDAPLTAAQFLPWLREHDHRRSIAVEDARTDPRTLATNTAAYFEARNVGALLAAAVRRHGRVVGVVSLKHVGGPRAWEAAEQEFAAALADLISLALERAERLRAEEARREQERRYRAVSELTSDYAFAVRLRADGTDELVWATEAFARVTGYAPEEVEGLAGLLALFHPENAASVRLALGHLADGEAIDFEARLLTKDGEERWVRHRARPGEPDADGTVVHYHGGEDVTDRKRFEQELIAAREEAEEMARLKSAFLANMSHEIRTPLTGILGYAGLLAEEVSDPEHRESVEFIERSGQRLLDTLNSVLELARLEASGVRPQHEVLDVAAEARQSARLLAPLAEAKGLRLAVRTPERPVQARLDRTCLARILNNLLGNAVKFTEEGEVAVEVRADATHAHVRIADTGVGIGPEFLPRIFDEFRQETDGDARQHEGAGLGLAITRRLVDLLGGAVAVESRKGEGTTFTVTFPLHEPVPAPAHFELHDEVFTDAALTPPEEPMMDAPLPSADPPADPPVVALSAAELFTSEPIPADEAEAFSGLWEELEADALAPAASADGGADPAPGYLLAAIFPTDEGDGAPDDLLLDWSDDDAPAEVLPAERLLFLDDVLPEAAPAEPLGGVFALDAAETAAHDGDGAGDGAGAASASWIAGGDVPATDDLVLTPASPPTPTTPMDPRFDDDGVPETPAASRAPAPPDAAADPGDGRPTILVVEDNADTRALLDRILRAEYRTFAVGDARSALDLLHRERFDAVLLDINLGGRETGVDVLRIARSLPGNAALFSVALTAYALPGDRERFLEAGFDQYVSKPFTRSTLMAALREGMTAA